MDLESHPEATFLVRQIVTLQVKDALFLYNKPVLVQGLIH